MGGTREGEGARSRKRLVGAHFAVAEAEAGAADEAPAGGEEQAVAIEKGCALGHERCGKRCAGDSAARVESVDPCLGKIGVAGLGVRTHRHEEFADFVKTGSGRTLTPNPSPKGRGG